MVTKRPLRLFSLSLSLSFSSFPGILHLFVWEFLDCLEHKTCALRVQDNYLYSAVSVRPALCLQVLSDLLHAVNLSLFPASRFNNATPETPSAGNLLCRFQARKEGRNGIKKRPLRHKTTRTRTLPAHPGPQTPLPWPPLYPG
jgi:hypothetical protein